MADSGPHIFRYICFTPYMDIEYTFLQTFCYPAFRRIKTTILLYGWITCHR